jgi:pyroglutamyl-peptidase
LSSPARTLLVTGFEPFGGETLNASWEAAQRLEGWRHGEYVAVARLLPCAYDASVKELIQAIETLRPDALLMTGQAARRGAGALRRGLRISRDAPEWLEAAAPVRAIVRAVNEAGIRTRVSRNAGTFVCNHLYFGALQYLGAGKRPIPTVFLHLPVTPEQTPRAAGAMRLTAAKAADALRAAAAVMIDRSESSEAA